MAGFEVGIIGTGLIAADHARSLRLIREVGQLQVFDVSQSRAAAFADAFDAALAPEVESLVRNVDIVWICTPPRYHLEAVRLACKHGKPIFCEKPLAHSLRDGRAIAKAVSQAKVPFFMGLSNRWNRVFQRLAQLVQEGRIGQPVVVRSTRLGWMDLNVHPAWRADDEISGGAIVEIGVHEIDFIRMVGGDWLEASAFGSSRTIAPGKFQDTVVATGQLAGGAEAHLELSWADPRYLWQRGVLGTEGSLHWDDSRFTEIEHHRPRREPKTIRSVDWQHPETKENLAIREQARAIVKAVKFGDAPFVSLDDGLQSLAAAAAIRRSAASRRRVKLN